MYERGTVVMVENDPLDPVNGGAWLVLSNRTYPRQGRTFLAVAMDDEGSDGAVRIAPDDWADDGIQKPCFALPYVITPRYHDACRERIGRLAPSKTDEVAESTSLYIARQ